MQGRGCLARSTISFGREGGYQLTGFGRETWTVPPSGGVSWAQVHRDRSLHLGDARVPPGSPPSRVVRKEEMDERLLAVKRAIHDFVNSSSPSGKIGTGTECGCEPRPAPRNQSSSCEGSGLGGLLTSSPILTAARASMVVSSGSGVAVAGLLEPENRARVAAEGANPFRKERRDRNEVMLICPQQAHESSTNASSACWKPRH